MSNSAGIWIDHHQAIVVTLHDGIENVQTMHPGKEEGDRSHSTRDYFAEDKRDRKAAAHLQHFYDDVILALKDSVDLLVIGPGEAKGEFCKRIESVQPKTIIRQVEAADKMSNGQVAAHVVKFFAKGMSPISSKKQEVSS